MSPSRFLRAPSGGYLYSGRGKVHLLDGRGLDTRRAICGYKTPLGAIEDIPEEVGWSGEATDDLCLRCLDRTVETTVPWKGYRLIGEWNGMRREIAILGQYDYTTRRLTESLGGTVREGIQFDAVATAAREMLNASAEEWTHGGMPPVWSKGEISIIEVESGTDITPNQEEE